MTRQPIRRDPRRGRSALDDLGHRLTSPSGESPNTSTATTPAPSGNGPPLGELPVLQAEAAAGVAAAAGSVVDVAVLELGHQQC